MRAHVINRRPKKSENKRSSSAPNIPLEPQIETMRWYEAVELRQQGLALRAIGAQLGVSHVTIHNWLDEAANFWRDKIKDSLDTFIGHQIQVLMHVDQEAAAAWEASKKPEHRARFTSVSLGVAALVPVQKQIQSTEMNPREGNERFLEIRLQCHDRIARLLGLERQAVTDDATFIVAIRTTAGGHLGPTTYAGDFSAALLVAAGGDRQTPETLLVGGGGNENREDVRPDPSGDGDGGVG
jgi:hypothetical protein